MGPEGDPIAAPPASQNPSFLKDFARVSDAQFSAHPQGHPPMSMPAPPASSPPDPISAELERALFKRFWTWLAVVGTVVIVVVSGFSVIASQFVTSVINNRIGTLDDQLSDLRKRSLDTVGAIQQVVVDAALNAREAQQKSIAAAEGAKKAADGAQAAADSAQKEALDLDNKVRGLPRVEDLLKDTYAIVTTLMSKKEFVDRINTEISAKVNSVDRTLNIGRIIAAVEVRSGKTISISNGTSFDSTTGIISFQNPTNLKFVPQYNLQKYHW